MRKLFPIALIAFLCTTLSSCELVGGIFKAGVWSGIIIVVIVVALLIWILAKIFGGGRS
ncbi:hypothetical protein [Pedobacter sandarakinus]|uniref:hypothetical protein n=1 Tax=Pedobacter sandarakinus TaxID=353156 RepID=UPI002245C5AE|nr:hypothetical protein [Pedobacter sandarakinus]MCX2576203.1 hypothetical protein [Pedobacter sandarakinus]